MLQSLAYVERDLRRSGFYISLRQSPFNLETPSIYLWPTDDTDWPGIVKLKLDVICFSLARAVRGVWHEYTPKLKWCRSRGIHNARVTNQKRPDWLSYLESARCVNFGRQNKLIAHSPGDRSLPTPATSVRRDLVVYRTWMIVTREKFQRQELQSTRLLCYCFIDRGAKDVAG